MTAMACGPVRYTPGTPVKEIVVSGGRIFDPTLTASKTVDIFYVDFGSWRSARGLEDWVMARKTAFTIIPYGSTFLYIGSTAPATVLKYIPISDTWELILSKPN